HRAAVLAMVAERAGRDGSGGGAVRVLRRAERAARAALVHAAAGRGLTGAGVLRAGAGGGAAAVRWAVAHRRGERDREHRDLAAGVGGGRLRAGRHPLVGAEPGGPRAGFFAGAADPVPAAVADLL